MSKLDNDLQTLVARFEEGKPTDPTENMSPEDAAKWKAMNDEHGDKFKTAEVKLKIPAGTRVVVKANPASRQLYTNLPPDGSEGEVAPVSFGSTKRTFLPGPGGGMVYVKFDNGEFMGVSPRDLDKPAKGKKAMKDGSITGTGNTLEGAVNNLVDQLAVMDMALTAAALPGVELAEDAEALEALHKMAVLDRAADAMVGRTILEQMGGARRLQAMLGVREFVLLPNGVAFQWPNKTPTKGNYIEIRLNGADLYDVTFFNVGRGTKKVIKALDGVYAEDLVGIFERQTGWYLRMASEQATQLVGKTAMRARLEDWVAQIPGAEIKGSKEQRMLESFWRYCQGELIEAIKLDDALIMAAWDTGYQGRILRPNDAMAFLARVRHVNLQTAYRDGKESREQDNPPRMASDGDAKESKFEEGVSADPTENMSSEDAAEWEKQNDEHKDEFKTAMVTGSGPLAVGDRVMTVRNVPNVGKGAVGEVVAVNLPSRDGKPWISVDIQGNPVQRILGPAPMPASAVRKVAMEFDTPEALKEYLKEHPNADKAKHTVKDQGAKEDTEEEAPVAFSRQDSKALGDALEGWNEPGSWGHVVSYAIAGKPMEPKHLQKVKKDIDTWLNNWDAYAKPQGWDDKAKKQLTKAKKILDKTTGKKAGLIEDAIVAEGCPDNLDDAECKEWEDNTEKYKDVVKDQHQAADLDSALAQLELMAEGCPDNLDKGECEEWEANTEKYKDVVKDQHKEAAANYLVSLAPDGAIMVDGMVDEPLFNLIYARVMGLRFNQVKAVNFKVMSVQGHNKTYRDALEEMVQFNSGSGMYDIQPRGRNVFLVRNVNIAKTLLDDLSDEDENAMNRRGFGAKEAARELYWADGDRAAPWTPWGAADHAYEIARGVRKYSTPGHGGLAVAQGVARKVLTTAALKQGYFANGYYWYEEDVEINIPFYEHPEWVKALGYHQGTPEQLEATVRREFPRYFVLREQNAPMAPAPKPGMLLQVQKPINFRSGISINPGDVVKIEQVKSQNLVVSFGGSLYRLPMSLYLEDDATVTLMGSGGRTAAAGDPYWLTAKYPGRAKDGTPIKRGDRVLYYPRTKVMLAGKAAEQAWRDFEAAAFDEDVYNYRAAKATGDWKARLEQLWKGYQKEHPQSKAPPASLIERAKAEAGSKEDDPHKKDQQTIWDISHGYKSAAVNVRDLKTKVLKLIGPTFETRKNYSGRGMDNAVSPFAFAADVRPDSPQGKALQALGLSYDSMGMGYVYYIHTYGKAAYEEGSRVPDGWDNGQIEGEPTTDEPGEEGSDTPDGNGNQQKRAGEVIETLYALVSNDGYLFGATEDAAQARNKAFWRHQVDAEQIADSKVYPLTNVPLHLAEKLTDMGTSAQIFADGYAAWAAAGRYAKGRSVRLAALEEGAPKTEEPAPTEEPVAKEAASGLYGHTKRVQADCEGCIRKIQRTATSIVKAAYAKHEGVAEFLTTHAKRAESVPAQILVAALREVGPKVASQVRLAELRMAQTDKALGKTARALLAQLGPQPRALRDLTPPGMHFVKVLAAAETLGQKGYARFDGVHIAKITDANAQTEGKKAQAYGLYGFGEKVARLGLQACTDLRHEAGKLAHDLHSRRLAHHASITDFFANHETQTQCMYSRLLRASYPELKTAHAQVPQTVRGWLEKTV